MAIKQNKTRIAISLTDEQLAEIENTANQMGLTKSDLISVATMQYITSFKLSKDIAKSAISDAITKALKEGELNIEQLRG